MPTFVVRSLRELDQIVAEKIFNWCDFWEGEGRLLGYPPDELGIEGERCDVWEYSTDLTAAWAIVEKLATLQPGEFTYRMHRCSDWKINQSPNAPVTLGYEVRFGDVFDPTEQRERKAWAKSPALAICLAGLKVYGIAIEHNLE